MPQYNFMAMNRKWSKLNCSANTRDYYTTHFKLSNFLAGIISSSGYDLTVNVSNTTVTTTRKSTFKASSNTFWLNCPTKTSTPMGDFTLNWHKAGNNHLALDKIIHNGNIHEKVDYTVINGFLRVTQRIGNDSTVFYFTPSK